MAFELVAKNGLVTNNDVWYEHDLTHKSFVYENSQSHGCILTLRHTDNSSLILESISTSSFQFNLPILAQSITGSLSGIASYSKFSETASYVTGTFITSSNIYATTKLVTSTINSPSNVLTINARRISHVAGGNSIILGYNGLLNTSRSQDDVAIGNRVGESAITTSFAVLVGANAGQFADNLNAAVLIGIQAGMNLKNSYSSVFVGGNAGIRAISTPGTVGIGISVLPDASSSVYSVVAGGYAGQTAVNADRCVILGGVAAQYAINVNNSVMVGAFAGQNAKTGSNSILIGYGSDVLNNLVDANGSIGIGYNVKITKPYQTIIGNTNTTECLLYGNLIATGSLNGTSSLANNALTLNNLLVASSSGDDRWIQFGENTDSRINYNDAAVRFTLTNPIEAPTFIGNVNGTASWANNTVDWVNSNTKLNVIDPASSGSFTHTGSLIVQNATYVSPVSNVILTFNSGAGSYTAGNGNYGVRIYSYKTVEGINVYSTPVEVLQSDTDGTGLSIDDFYGVHITWTLPSEVDGVKILFYSDNKSYNWNVSHTGGGNYYDDSGGGLDLESTVTPTSPLIGAKSIINSPLDITGSVKITGSLTANLIGNASSATTASYAYVAESLAPKTSSWWIPLTSTVDSNGSFTALSNALQGSWLGTNYFNFSQQYSSGSGAITTRMAQLENEKIIGRNFRLTNYYAYSHSLVTWSFTPYLGIAGIHMTGSTTSASWASVTNAVARPLSGKGITSWSYSATAPSTDMFFHIRSGCGSPATHTNTVWLVGIKVDNW